MSNLILTICACHPRDGREVELIDFNPHRASQVCREVRTGLVDVIPTSALIVTDSAADGGAAA